MVKKPDKTKKHRPKYFAKAQNGKGPPIAERKKQVLRLDKITQSRGLSGRGNASERRPGGVQQEEGQ